MLDQARRVFEIEIEALRHVEANLGASFEKAVTHILECRGKVIVTGLGKSGAIARKIAATFSSTGTPAVFLHATEGLHGDIGVIDRNDLILGVSYSGETDEISLILPAIKRLGNRFVAITGNQESTLARNAEVVILVTVPKEACPMGLAPTSSTTATLVMGDALAVAVYSARGFTKEDFAFRHPGGSLGRALLRVSDLMHTGLELPLCRHSETLAAAVLVITDGALGMACIVDDDGRLWGLLTDGDIRRMCRPKIDGVFEKKLSEILESRTPLTIEEDCLAVQALTIMEERKITSLVVLDKERRPKGVLHIHDILRSKVV